MNLKFNSSSDMLFENNGLFTTLDILSAEVNVVENYMKDVKFAEHILTNLDELIKEQEQERKQMEGIIAGNEPKLEGLRVKNLILKFKMYNLIESFKNVNFDVPCTMKNENYELLRDTKSKINDLVKKLHFKIAKLQYKKYMDGQNKNEETKPKEMPSKKYTPTEETKQIEIIRPYSLKSHKLLQQLLQLLKHLSYS